MEREDDQHISRAGWAIVASAVLAGSALGQVDAAAEQVLRDSAEAVKDLDSVSYKAKRFYSGGPLDGLLDISGEVKIVRTETPNAALWLTGSIGVKNQEPTEFTAGSDGQTYSWLDKTTNKLFERPIADRKAKQTIENYTNQVLLDIFVEAEPYAGALKAASLKQTGVEEIGGVLCNVIEASTEDGRRTVYHIGVADLLPRRESMVGTNEVAKVLEIQDLQANAELKVEDLAIALPAGYEVDRFVQQQTHTPAQTQEPVPEVGLAAGSPAPAFDLPTISGEQKTLADYQGSVVVMTFWGPVFAKSEACLNLMQELHTYFEGQEIKFVGIACREPNAAAASNYVQQHGYTFDVLTGGTDTADQYKVLGFPSVVVLSKAGTVRETFLGCPTEDQLLAAVEKAAE